MKKALVLVLSLLLAVTAVMANGVPSSIDLYNSDDTCLSTPSTYLLNWGVATNDGNYGGVDESEFCLVWEVGCDDGDWADADMHFFGVDQVIEIRHLDGISNLDSFMVYVDGTHIDTYTDSQDSQENWVTSYFSVPADFTGTHTVELKIIDQEWGSCDTWGQLAIDYIKVYPDEGEIPEFGIIGAATVLGLAGLFIYRRRK